MFFSRKSFCIITCILFMGGFLSGGFPQQKLPPDLVSFFAHASVDLIASHLEPGESLGEDVHNSRDMDRILDWARKQSPVKLKELLTHKFLQMLDKKSKDTESIAQYYAHVCSVMGGYGVNFGSPEANSLDFDPHYNWARNQPLRTLQQQIMMRLDKIFSSYEADSLTRDRSRTKQIDRVDLVRKGGELVRATPGTTLEKTSRKNPFTPIMVRLIRRYLADRRDMNRLDRAFRNAVQEVGGIDRSVLEKISDVYMRMDSKERSSKFETIALDKGDLAPITISDVKQSFQRVNPSLFKSQLEWIPGLSLPQLTAIDPIQSSKGYSPGVLLTLTGNNFSPVAKQNGVEILAQGASTRSFGVVPITSTKNQMQFVLPKNINSGLWRLRVLVGANKTPSNELAFQVYVPTKPLPIPYITSISPKSTKPGDKVYINGKNFDKHSNFVSMKTLNVKPAWSKAIFNTKVIGAGLNQLEMVIPKYAPPCQYTMQVFSGLMASNKAPYTVAGYKYRVVFDEMHCIDETNPESGGADEMVTFWVVISDDTSFHKNTSEYSGFNDGTKWSYKPSDAMVLDWTEIKRGLSVATEFWEWDEGDIESAKKVVAISGKVASKLIGYFWGPTAGTVAGEIMTLVVDSFGWIAKNIFGVDNDRMGRVIQTWSQQKLIDTLNPQKPKKYTLNFKDHGGEYNIYFRLLSKK